MDLDEEGSEKIDDMIKNWGRWSSIVNAKSPQIAFLDIWLENILSIRVLEWPVILGIDEDIPKLSNIPLTKVILFGDSKYSDFQTHDILNEQLFLL